jgi:hypothetical protein
VASSLQKKTIQRLVLDISPWLTQKLKVVAEVQAIPFSRTPEQVPGPGLSLITAGGNAKEGGDGLATTGDNAPAAQRELEGATQALPQQTVPEGHGMGGVTRAVIQKIYKWKKRGHSTCYLELHVGQKKKKKNSKTQE